MSTYPPGETFRIVDDFPIDAYHASPAVSKTGLDAIARSPAYYRGRDNRPNVETPARLMGHLAHCAVLEPDQFALRYAIKTKDGRTVAGKEEAAEIKRAGKTCVTEQQAVTAWIQAAAMRLLPDFAVALANGVAERSAFWTDEATGVECRCRPDWTYFVGPGKAVLFDVKTFSDASAGAFARQVARMRYHVQAAFYSDGYARAAGVEVLGFVFIAVEDEYPFVANALMLDEESVERGRQLYRRDLETLARCQATDTWPGYGDAIQMITLPRWAMKEE